MNHTVDKPTRPASARIITVALALVVAAAVLTVVGWLAVTVGAEAAQIVIDTNPSRASVEVNGNFHGTTPLTIGEVPVGTHVLRITKFGYRPMQRKVTLKPGENTFAYDLPRLPGGSLEIVSRPEDADVYIDGDARGRTPLTVVEVPAGEHEIRLSKVNYIDRVERVEIAQNEKAKLDVTLTTRTEDFYVKKIEVDPKAAKPRTDLAHYHILQHEWKKAENRYKEALVLVVEESESRGYAGRLYDELNRVFVSQFDYGDGKAVKKGRETVVNALLGAVRETPRHIEHYHQAIRFCQQLSLPDKAQEILEIGIITFPYKQNWHRQAFRSRRRRDSSGNLQQIDARIRKNPDDFSSRFQRMNYMREQNNLDEVVKELEQLVRLARDVRVKARLLSDMGRYYERLKKYDRAVSAYTRAVKMQPDPKTQASIQYNLVRALERADNKDKLPEAWERAIELQDNEEIANQWRLEYAEACIRHEWKERARKVLDEVIGKSKSEKTRNDARKLLDGIK